MKRFLALTLTCFFAMATSAFADPKICDVTYTVDTNVVVGARGPNQVEHDAGTTIAVVNAMPYADVLDNSDKMKKVVNVMAREQDHGGPYDLESGEVRSCDGGAPVKVAATALLASGVTLAGANRIARASLQQMSLIVGRYEGRASRGDKTGWDHTKGPKTKRNDLHQKLVAPTSDSVVVAPK